MYYPLNGRFVLVDDDVTLPGDVSEGVGVIYLPHKIPLRRYVLGLKTGDRDYVYHLNGDHFDCRRKNLSVGRKPPGYGKRPPVGDRDLPKNITRGRYGRLEVKFIRRGQLYYVGGYFKEVDTALAARNDALQAYGYPPHY